MLTCTDKEKPFGQLDICYPSSDIHYVIKWTGNFDPIWIEESFAIEIINKNSIRYLDYGDKTLIARHKNIDFKIEENDYILMNCETYEILILNEDDFENKYSIAK